VGNGRKNGRNGCGEKIVAINPGKQRERWQK
jgi:hypothetical protein